MSGFGGKADIGGAWRGASFGAQPSATALLAAQEAAERMSRRMVLIDGDRLTALMIRHVLRDAL